MDLKAPWKGIVSHLHGLSSRQDGLPYEIRDTVDLIASVFRKSAPAALKLKRQWFEVLARGMSDQGGVQGR